MFKATANLFRGYKRQKRKSMNTFDSLRPISIVTYMVGFRVFEYPRGNFWRKFSFLYGMILYSIYLVGLKYQREIIQKIEIFNVQETMFRMSSIFNEVAIFLMILVGCYHSKSLKLYVRRIHEVDLTLRALGAPECFNTIYKKAIGLLILIFSQVVFYGILHLFWLFFYLMLDRETMVVAFSTFTQFYGQIVEYMLIIEFFIIVSCIGSEFQRANDLLSDINVLPSSSIAMELLDYDNSKDPFSTHRSFFDISAKSFTPLPTSRRLRSHLQNTSHEIIRSRRLLQTIRQVHLELYKVSKCISMIYGIQISMETSLCILYMTYSLYSLYYMYKYDTFAGIVTIATTIGTLFWSCNNFAKNFSVNYICEKTALQSQRTNQIIHTFYGQSTDSELQEEMEMFSLQMIHCRIMFSASGLYTFNFKNIFGNIGIIATYVVIMIQVTSSIKDE